MDSALILLALAAQAPPNDLPAFPGAEGAGAMSLGGRGGRVLRVTNLQDSGPGSLRAAIDASGPRIIIFDIGGTIRLLTPLSVRNGRVTIAGQTAPGGGITIRDQRLDIRASDVVVRFIRSRLGDVSGVTSDAFWISGGQRIILDHVSASWATDETLSATSYYRTPETELRDVTVQWSIIAESLCKPAEAPHCFGSLTIGSRAARMSFHHNLWAHHLGRMPRPGNYVALDQDPDGSFFDFRYNVFYNWGGKYAGSNADTSSRASYNFVDNSYLTGPNSKDAFAFAERNPNAKAWFAGNSMNGTVPIDPMSLVSGGDRSGYRLAAPLSFPSVTASGSGTVLNRAGASLIRDAVDKRIVASVRNRTGKLVVSQRDVGGWPPLAKGAPWRDADGDGVPDDWEKDHRLDPSNPADGAADRDGDGYTNVEEWLNALARPAM